MNSQYYKSLGAILITCFFAACMQEGISQYNYCPKEDIILQHFAGAADPTQLKEILENNPNIDPNACCPEHKYTALMAAVRKKDETSVGILFEVLGDRIDVNKQNEDGDTALILAVQEGHLDTINELLGRPDIQVNLKNNKGYTALAATFLVLQKTEQDTALLRSVMNAATIRDLLRRGGGNMGITRDNSDKTIFHQLLDTDPLTEDEVMVFEQAAAYMLEEERQALLAYIEKKSRGIIGGMLEKGSKLLRSGKGKKKKQGGTSTRPKKLVKQSRMEDRMATPSQDLHSRSSRKRLGSKPGVESHSGSTKKKKPKKTDLLEQIKTALRSDDSPNT